MALPVQISTEADQIMVNSVMTLGVVSRNQDFIVLCREVLRALGDTPYGLQVECHSETLPDCEVCLWDYEPDEPMPAPHRPGSPKIFYLVHPANLESLRARMPAAEGNILLKPVTRAILQTFLGSVAVVRSDQWRLGDAMTEVGTLRAVRDEILQSLLHANLRLQEYDQQRTNFIARAVHDFRAPLTALSGFCGLLEGEELGPLNEQQKEALHRMNHSTKRLSRMASAMFDLSIGPRVSPELDLREGDIRERIEQALHEILPIARQKQISLSAECVAEPTAPLCFDGSQVEQVLVNLLDNACKFTPRKGSIEVSGYPDFWDRRFLRGGSAPLERRAGASQSPNSYRVDVADTGPGVPYDRREHIFEEYTSYCGAQDRSGGGLGLAICRLILSRHQGRIWVESRREGAVFAFVIPYKRREAQGNIPSPPNC